VQILGARTLAFLLECQFTLLVVVLVLSSTPILSSLLMSPSVSLLFMPCLTPVKFGEGTCLSLILRHID
jgi:hypothetical protein